MIHRMVLSLVLLIQLGCSSHDNKSNTAGLKVIDVAGGVGKSRQVNLSEIADSIEYIPLETSKESLLNTKNLYQMFFGNEKVFLPNKISQIISVFSSNGKYLYTLNKIGRGPQEYEQLGLINIDNETGNIFIKVSGKILEYSHEGLYIKTINLPNEEELNGISLYRFCKLNNFFIFSASIFRGSQYSAVIVDSISKVIMKLKYPQEEIDFVQKLPRAFDFIYPYIYLHDKSVRLINGNNRYVLSISEELTVDTAFIINYGKYDVIHDNSTTKYTPNSPYLWKKFDVYESNNYLFMIFHTGSLGSKTAKMISLNGSEYIYPFSCSIFNKNTGEFTFLDQPEINQLGFVDDIEGGPAIWPKYVSSDNYLISFIPAEEFIAHAEKHKVSANYKEIAAKLQEADNPVLVKVKLK